MNSKKHLFPFEKLEVWHKSKEFIIEIYRITGKFPDGEKYGLRSQLNRASVSVSANIAEGSSRVSFKEQAHFSQLAYSSLMEVACLLDICKDLKLLEENLYADLREKMLFLSNKINALRISQKRRVEGS